MSDNTLSVATPGQDIPADHHNELVQALLQNQVPRNTTRAPEDLAGSLGTSVFRFLRAYVNEYRIGAVLSNLRIYEGAANELWIERNSNADEIIKIKENVIELWMSGSLIVSFGENGITTPNLYINPNSMVSNEKILVGTYFAPDEGDFGNPVTFGTINGLKAGKKVLIQIFGKWTNTGSGGNDRRLRVNGNIVFTPPEGDVNEIFYKYTIPTDGNYTFDIDYRDGGTVAESTYRIEEL